MELEQFKIEKGIPLPPRKGRKNSSKYPWYQLEIGDSFVGPMYMETRMTWAKRKTGFTFATRRILGTKQVRIWRTA